MKLNLALIATLFISLSAHAQTQAVTTDELNNLLGYWKGTLTYVDYGSGNPYTMPADLSIKNGLYKKRFLLRTTYPNEPKANSRDVIVLSNDGKRINRKLIISKEKIEDDGLKIVTVHVGKDDNREARIRNTYYIWPSRLSIRKEVRYDDTKKWIKRNEYNFQRVDPWAGRIYDTGPYKDELSLRLDSVERKIVEGKFRVDTSYYLHFSVSNLSEDTIIFNMNSCPSYDLYELEVNGVLYEMNTRVRCTANSYDAQEILPQQTIALRDKPSTRNIEAFDEEASIKFKIPMVKDSHHGFRIQKEGGQGFVVPEQKGFELVFEGKSKFVSHFNSNLTKRQKRRKSK